jgi:hypothetical protein
MKRENKNILPWKGKQSHQPNMATEQNVDKCYQENV